MNGLFSHSRRFEKSKKPETFLEFINRSTNGFPKEELEIHLCVDNDAAGRDFVQSITNKYGAKFSITEDLPPLHTGQTKNDWNDELKYSKGMLELPKTQKISPRKSLKINH
ncbi:toprim domain-containing protein [Lactococcus lactis]